MLKIKFGITDKVISKIRDNFIHGFRNEWLEDPLVKEMILDIDKSVVESPYCIMSPVLGQIAPERLSGGVQALILMYKTDFPVNASKCGDNCAKWILEIAKRKDLTIHLYHLMGFDTDFTAEMLDTGVIIHTNREYLLQSFKIMDDLREKDLL